MHDSINNISIRNIDTAKRRYNNIVYRFIYNKYFRMDCHVSSYKHQKQKHLFKIKNFTMIKKRYNPLKEKLDENREKYIWLFQNCMGLERGYRPTLTNIALAACYNYQKVHEEEYVASQITKYLHTLRSSEIFLYMTFLEEVGYVKTTKINSRNAKVRTLTKKGKVAAKKIDEYLMQVYQDANQQI